MTNTNTTDVKAIPSKLYDEIWIFVNDILTETSTKMMLQADDMAMFADSPNGVYFQSAVNAYKNLKEQSKHCYKILEQLESI